MHDAFLAAIADRPDDDLPRLVYADYLEETGQPERAEFIRVQIETAKLPPADPRQTALKDRESQLLTQRNRAAWGLAEFRGEMVSQQFRRGFVERVSVRAEWLVEHPTALLSVSGPLRAVRVVIASGFVGRLAEVPGLARLEELDLNGTRFNGADDVRTFFTTARLDNLRELVVRNSTFREGEEIAALADTPVAPRLRRLDVSGNRLADAGAGVLASRPEFGNLEVLTFRADELDQFWCVHVNGAEALANSATLTRLKVLDLGDHYIGNVGLTRLVHSPNASNLERLAVEYTEIGRGQDDRGRFTNVSDDSGILAVVESPRLANLRELRFGGNELGRLGAEALAAWPHLEKMEAVDLKESPLTDAVRGILRRSRWADKFILS
jgi:uncharacterized protein (TIGR02996 family)